MHSLLVKKKIIPSVLSLGIPQVQTNNKISRLFSGTQEKCVVCKKTVYPIEKVYDIVSDIQIVP